MVADVEIGKLALQKMGETTPLISLFPPDNTKPARELNACYNPLRRALLRAYRWSFAKERASLAAEATPPAGEYLYQYELPTDCLSLRTIGNARQQIDVDYKTGMEQLYSIRGRMIETNLTPPLAIVYTKDVTDTSLFDACFVIMFACDMSLQTCESITQSDSKKESIRKDRKLAKTEALRANAIELPPQAIAEDSWVNSRL